ncbi:MAG: hypothetical protein ABW051_10080, partial [Burkholderiaceae bacterium]
ALAVRLVALGGRHVDEATGEDLYADRPQQAGSDIPFKVDGESEQPAARLDAPSGNPGTGSLWRSGQALALRLKREYPEPEIRCKALDEIERMEKPSDMQEFFEWAVRNEELIFFDDIAALFEDKPRITVRIGTLEEASSRLCDNISVEYVGASNNAGREPEGGIRLMDLYDSLGDGRLAPQIAGLFKYLPYRDDSFPTAEELKAAEWKEEVRTALRDVMNVKVEVAVLKAAMLEDVTNLGLYEHAVARLAKATDDLKKLLDEGGPAVADIDSPTVTDQGHQRPETPSIASPQQDNSHLVGAGRRVELAEAAVAVIQTLLAGNPGDTRPLLRQLMIAMRELQTARKNLADLTRT